MQRALCTKAWLSLRSKAQGESVLSEEDGVPGSDFSSSFQRARDVAIWSLT